MDETTPEGVRLKEEGMERALQAKRLHNGWKKHFADAVDVLKANQFTSEDVVDLVGLPNDTTGQHKNNAVGAMMSGLAIKKVIRKTGAHVRSRNRSSHGAELTQWTAYENMPQPVEEKRSRIVGERNRVLNEIVRIRQEVNSLHKPRGSQMMLICSCCKTRYPCQTVRALKPERTQ